MEEAEDFKCDFVIYCGLEWNRSAPERELLSNNSLFVVQLYEDKSLALPACDLIFFTTGLLKNSFSELSPNNSQTDLYIKQSCSCIYLLNLLNRLQKRDKIRWNYISLHQLVW